MNKKLGMMALALMVAVVMVASPLAFIGGSDNADAPILGAGESSVNGTYTIGGVKLPQFYLFLER